MLLNKYLYLSLGLTLIYSCTNSNAEYKKKSVVDETDLVQSTTNKYLWHKNYDIKNAIVNRIPTPQNFSRIEVKQNSFGDWLRHLPLKSGKQDVYLYNGKLKNNQSVHEAVVDIDVGKSDLQQCADAVMRVRGEYLYSIGDYKNLHFNFTSGDNIGFEKWSRGNKVVVKGNKVVWNDCSSCNITHESFRQYMNSVFMYAGTASLSKELHKVENKNEMQIGDVFIIGGFPGHAVLIVDMCENKQTGEKLFLIQQSYMPAQEIHILKNYNDANYSPWYSINYSNILKTPEWDFSADNLMRF